MSTVASRTTASPAVRWRLLPTVISGRARATWMLLRRRWRHDLHQQAPITNPASSAVRDFVGLIAAELADSTGHRRYGELFQAQLLDTWERTLTHRAAGRVFVITGDIPAMWLRDSSAQLRPFVLLLQIARTRGLPVADELQRTLVGVCNQQWDLISIDPYANAFNAEPDGLTWHVTDLPAHPQVWERKYEIDSLAFAVQLSWQVWALSGETSHLGSAAHTAARLIVDLWRAEQQHERSGYRFVRLGSEQESLPRRGRGTPVAPCGLTWSGFRPSDDRTHFGYNIPAQVFAAHALRLLAELSAQVWQDADLAGHARALADELDAAIARHGVMTEGYLAYEVDGLGNQLFADDANMPSLLSLPLCSALSRTDPLYLATRAAVLSPKNPYFVSGTHASGVGSPHTPGPMVWPIALAVQGLTSSDTSERDRLLETLTRTDAGTGMMHESFDVEDPEHFTRDWFSWANSMWCELLLTTAGYRLPRGPLSEPVDDDCGGVDRERSQPR